MKLQWWGRGDLQDLTCGCGSLSCEESCVEKGGGREKPGRRAWTAEPASAEQREEEVPASGEGAVRPCGVRPPPWDIHSPARGCSVLPRLRQLTLHSAEFPMFT